MNFAWIIMCKMWSVDLSVSMETCFFAGSSPYYCIICAISMCYTCQLYDVCYLHISGILTFCIFFPFVLCILFETTFYVFHVNLLMHINMTDDHARAVHWYSYLSSCSDIHMNIFIFDENCSLYCILLHIIYCNITLIIFMAHTFSTITYHMNFYHIQSTLCFMYYRCFRTVYYYLLHSLLLKLYM